MNALAERIMNAEVVSLTPDMTVVDGGKARPPAMPTDLFGDAWPLIEGIAEGTGAPDDYAALSFLACAASAIGGKRRVMPFATSGWSEPAVLWCALVGSPSTNKSPPMDAMIAPLEEIELEGALEHEGDLGTHSQNTDVAKAEYQIWQKDIADALKQGKTPPTKPESAELPDEPIRKRHVVKDITPEKLAEILSGNPQGVLHYRDELPGWFSSFDRYAPGGRTLWLEAYRGSTFTIDRKGGGTTMVPYNGVCVLGSLQPDRARQIIMTGADDGLAARFLYAWPDSIPFRRPQQYVDPAKLGGIYRRLTGLTWNYRPDGSEEAISLHLDSSAADLFEQYLQVPRGDIATLGSLVEGFYGKRQGLILRLALIGELVGYAASDGQEPRSVSSRMVGAAIDFFEQYALPSALRVFGDAALPEVERNMAVLAKYILRKNMRRINARELKHSPHKTELPTLRKAEAMDAAIKGLVEAFWLFPDPRRQGDTTGRHSADYITNPQVFGG